MDEIDVAYKDAVNGISSRRPLIEMTIPSILDKTISPPGIKFYPTYISKKEPMNNDCNCS